LYEFKFFIRADCVEFRNSFVWFWMEKQKQKWMVRIQCPIGWKPKR
jgi:hypothetical protein